MANALTLITGQMPYVFTANKGENKKVWSFVNDENFQTAIAELTKLKNRLHKQKGESTDMKGQYYLTDYLIEKNIKIEKGYINLFNAPAGSGKTSFVFGNKNINRELKNNGLIYGTPQFVDYKTYNPFIESPIPNKYHFYFGMDKTIYLCDTSMLKDKVLSKYSDITKTFKDHFFKEAKKESFLQALGRKTGRVTVMTYKQFGWCMGIKNIRDFILDNINLVIMDEFHNLFSYNNKFHSKKDTSYQNVIDNIVSISTHCLLVCLTATPYYANMYIFNIIL